MQWTADQQKAIDGRGGTLLVSAAAGSGKTAVLVERVIQRICDAAQPCDIENLLIVTFTNAAAAQMKEKIAAAIDRRLAEDPANRHLRRQQLMLPCANICTIDAFCIDLVRQNFHALGVAPDFTLLDEGEAMLLREAAMQSVLQARLTAREPGFMALAAQLGNGRDDRKLTDAIRALYALSQAYPFPQDWLRGLEAPFAAETPVDESVWGQEILRYVHDFLQNARRQAQRCLVQIAQEPELAGYQAAFESDLQLLDRLEAALETPWDALCAAFAAAAFERIGRVPRGYESAGKALCQSVRKDYKAELKKIAESQLCITQSEHAADLAALRPAVHALVEATLGYAAAFTAGKRARNTADFNDILHLALQLLLEKREGQYVKTRLAESLSAQYTEILVDEYQDVNAAQDMIFNALSDGERNLFMVGDVKQSIYGFRRAMPEIFLARRDALADYVPGQYPARVTLGKNFRSRSGVTEIVNFIFEAVMSRAAGGVEYDAEERLEVAAAYAPQPGPDSEVWLVEAPKERYLEAQAAFLADYITDAVRSGMTVREGEGVRPAEYRDFCILLRSVQTTTRPFTETFARRGIPCLCEAGRGILSAPEVRFLLSLLKVINDPLEEIPLTAVLLSPAFGFTPDDLARMRTAQREGTLYHSLTQAAETGDDRAAAFLATVQRLRQLAAMLPTGELLRRLIAETGYDAIVCAMTDSERRRANLNLLVDLANQYEHNGGRGVSGFLRYVDAVVANGGDLKTGESKSEAANAVRIMTIHKSKGLEFPVCILAGCERLYNEADQRADLILAPRSGIGLMGGTGAIKYDTVPRIAARIEVRRANHSEELRILYVALTRAKERLLVLAADADWGRRLAAIAAKSSGAQKLPAFTVNSFTRYADVVLAALLRHPDAHALRMAAGLPEADTLPCAAPLKADIVRPAAAEAAAETERPLPPPDPAIIAQLRERLDYTYPFAALNGEVAKRIASRMEPEGFDPTFFAAARPAFLSREKLTPTQRGTATHAFMECASPQAACENASQELKRLVAAGLLTRQQAEAVDLRAIERFYASPLAARMFRADAVYREQPFRVGLPLAELRPDLESAVTADERIVVEGVVDLAFEEEGALVIVDYKTDRVTAPETLAERYRSQLRIYRRCLCEALNLPVKETLIYSFHLHTVIAVD